ncbi:MAG: hypothetical protein KY454_06250 [Actinobacteria bacterium]|nr:hypothetical protein [Actinomycetota bacterium]MBW3650637.1 hypothetical protein [Actinomycetota bacterium]
MTDAPDASPVYAGVIGQEAAVANLRAAARAPVHAYLFVGQAGTGVREAARAFAADVLCDAGGCGVCSSCAGALAERHPDLTFVERSGASIRVQEIDEVIRLASRPPGQSRFKVIVLVDFHLVDQHYARLLKTLEEPPPTTVFVVLAEQVTAELVTIASRCVRVDFAPLAPDVIRAVLVSEGTDPALAEEVAGACGGRLDRGRLLAADPGFAARRSAWCSVPTRLDGTGAAVARVAEELLAGIDTVLHPLRARHAAEMADLEERVEAYGQRASGRKELEDRHKREQRRVRADELRFGMVALAAVYRDALVAGAAAGPARVSPAGSGDVHAPQRCADIPRTGRAEGGPQPGTPPVGRRGAVAALRALDAAGEALVRNPNEALLVQGLLVALTDAADL